jgi:type II secretory pathway pseudopilin PulG
MTPARQRAVILLEAIIALVVIAGVAGACLSLRSRAIRQRIAVQQTLEIEDALSSIMTLATSGLLDTPSVETDDSGASRRVWRGDWNDEPYTVTAQIVDVGNPLIAQSADAPVLIPMRRWTVEFRGARVEELSMERVR